MVLQRRKPLPVWGWASAGEKITITLNGQRKTAKAAKDGTWRVRLDPMEAGGPYQMIVSGKDNSITLVDVLLGEVWVCSGQSNMEWPLIAAANGKEEVQRANYPTIRQLLVKKDLSLTPKEDVSGEWAVCSPATAGQFTAVGYFFARQLQRDLDVPIGLVNTSWGGTHSETWTSREALSRDSSLRYMVDKLPANTDEVSRNGRQRTQELIQAQQGNLPSVAEQRMYASVNLNTSQWKSMNMPGDWQWGGLPNLDGVVWFRREIVIPEGQSTDGMTLVMGSVDDTDSTFVNGQLVGSYRGQKKREYVLPTGLLKPGRNVIAVRVEDTGGAGGIVGPADQLKLVGAGEDIPLAGQWQYRVASINPSSYQPGPNSYPTQLFNAMLAPLIPYAIQGVIWYQGESNAGRSYQYRRAFPAMIQDWRQRWGEGDFPFLFVQLASFNAGGGNSEKGSGWAELREAQTMTLSLPATGMAVTSDIGEPTDIHPRNKQDVGLRLAAEAMRVAYDSAGKAGTQSRGPMFDKMTVSNGQVMLSFKNAASGLMTKDKYGYVRGFEVAGADQQFHFAKAEIRGDAVIVHADAVTTPVAVRYGWADDNSEANLYNKAGFPAVPFRTDTWKGITENGRFTGQ
jgi:sialate O-acetylesterase